MTGRYTTAYAASPRALLLFGLFTLVASSTITSAQPSPAAIVAYDTFVHSVESCLARQHQTAVSFLANLTPGSPRDLRLRSGELVVEDLHPASPPALPGALLHHWRATAFVSGATAVEFDHLLRNFPAYPRVFAPQVQRIAVLSGSRDSYRITMRIVERHVLVVVLDLRCSVTFSRFSARYGSSASVCTTSPDSDALAACSSDHGLLWRANTYWSWEQRDGGLYLQIESVSLSRSIPFGLAWAVRPYVDSIPRDSLTFTLNSARSALRQLSRAPAPSLPSQLHTERNRSCPHPL